MDQPRSFHVRLTPLLLLLTLSATLTACALLVWERRPDAAEGAGRTLRPEEQTTIELFRRSSLSVVHIQTPNRIIEDSWTRRQVPGGSGTGFVWDDQGHVVTNFHVVQDSTEVLVIFADNSVAKADVIGRAPSRDLAVVRLKEKKAGVSPLPLGTSRDLQVGQSVYAIGNPFGYDQSLTTGIVSALGREIVSLAGTKIWDVIQTDAAINPGNSGGPLLDSSGQVIGVNTAIYSPSGANSGIGFAIPADSLLRVVPDLIEHGEFRRPVIGFVPVPETVRESLKAKGVLIREVSPGSPAARAGFKPTLLKRSGQFVVGDLIVAVNDRSIASRVDLDKAMDDFRIGDEVTVTLERGGKRRDVKVRLQGVDD